MSFFFRGLTGSDSIEKFYLTDTELSAEGIRSMVPFFKNAYNLMYLNLDNDNLQSEGFNVLWRALQNSPIECLDCSDCGIEYIELDSEQKPMQLQELNLDGNNINADGCHELAKLLQGRNSTPFDLSLAGNKIDDEGVGILVDALQKNTSLTWLNLERNSISKQGQCMLLKLVNNISSIEATLQSNHILKYLLVDRLVTHQDIRAYILMAMEMNRNESNPADVGRTKIIKTQLHGDVRADLAELQGVSQSLYSEINPLHLPEVIALIGRHHDQGELYMALKSSIAGMISTVNRKKWLQQERAYYRAKIEDYSTKIAEFRAKVEAVEAEIATIEGEGGQAVDMGSESLPRNKRRREW